MDGSCPTPPEVAIIARCVSSAVAANPNRAPTPPTTASVEPRAGVISARARASTGIGDAPTDCAPHGPCGGRGRACGRATVRKKTRAGPFARATGSEIRSDLLSLHPHRPAAGHALVNTLRTRGAAACDMAARTRVDDIARAAEDRRRLARVKKHPCDLSRVRTRFHLYRVFYDA